jgi:hypothetical protein
MENIQKTEWSILSMEHLTDNGFVINVMSQFAVSELIEDKELMCRKVANSSFVVKPEDEDYIPFNDLTEQIVLSWVWESINKEEFEAEVILQFETAKKEAEKPKTSNELPPNWNA